jgi:hypothetical protein
MPHVVLPEELHYHPSLPTLPTGVQQIEQCLLPVNGQTFSCATGGTQVQWDLPQHGYIDPQSMYIRYSYAVTNSAATNYTSIVGCPVYAPIQKLEVIFGSQTVESQNNYNQINHMVSNITMDVAQKSGLETAYGYYNGTSQSTTYIEQMNGRACTSNETGSFAAPLPCILSHAEHFIPLGMMPNVRVQLTLDALKNFTSAVANSAENVAATGSAENPTNFVISNFELCFTLLEFPEDVNTIVRNSNEKFYIKSSSFTNSSSVLSLAGLGTQELVFSTRLASVKSLFLLCPISSANGVNLNFDSFDITNGGSYQFSIAGKYYPPKPLSQGNKSGVLMELKKAVGSLYSSSNSMSITNFQFNATRCGKFGCPSCQIHYRRKYRTPPESWRSLKLLTFWRVYPKLSDYGSY